MNPISLEEVSSFVGFNPTYFSTLFKKENGGNFVEYLSEIRMAVAADQLRVATASAQGILGRDSPTMPRVAWEIGAVEYQLPLTAIAAKITALAGE